MFYEGGKRERLVRARRSRLLRREAFEGYLLLVLFFAAQRYFIQGVVISGVKG